MDKLMLLLSIVYVAFHAELDSFNFCSDSPNLSAIVTG